MTAMLRAALLTAIAASSIPAAAAGQAASADSLLRRIEVLERKTTDLEQRVRELEALIRIEPSQSRPIPESSQWRDLQNWRRLRRGMTMDQVRTLLGEPERVTADTPWTYWFWERSGRANVRFDSRSEKVEGWSEPGR